MAINRSKTNNRLKELMTQKGITKSQLANLCGVSEDSIKSYRRGDNKNGLPLDVAIKIADKYGVTLDWLFGRSECQNETDFIVNTVLALDSVFRFTSRKDTSGNTYPVLLIDRLFHEYITDLGDLQRLKPVSATLKKTYASARKEVYDRYKEVFQRIFNTTGFNEETAIEICDFEGLTIVDILGNAIESKKKLKK